jgi:hypothetical protein
MLTQDRQCAHDITWRCVRVTTVDVGKQQVLHILGVCVCSRSYPARNVREPYYMVICGLVGRTVFFNIISQTARPSGKKGH